MAVLTKLHMFFVLHTLNRLQLLAFLFRQSVKRTGPSIASISSLIDILERSFFNLYPPLAPLKGSKKFFFN